MINLKTKDEGMKYVSNQGKEYTIHHGYFKVIDFAEVPNIYLPYLYRTYVALVNSNPRGGVNMGVIMQCLLYDNLGDVITG